MRFSILVAGIALLSAVQSATGQQATQSPLRQLEKEMLARISERAIANGGFRFGAGELDLRLPLRGEPAGRLDDHWSAALAATGTADVYLDSIVITTSAVTVRASYPVPATRLVVIDSISTGLALGDERWSVARQSAALPVNTTLRKNQEWRRQVTRFTIPIDSSFALGKSWPLFQVHLRVPETADNPLGLAWTYAHERKGFFLRHK